MTILKKPTHGTSINDEIIGTDGNEILHGFAGDDQIFAQAGSDKAFGNNGDDLIDGGAGNDDLRGDNGNDGLAGGDGDDKLDGGNGRDFLVGGAGNDQLTGGNGDDTFVMRHGTGVDTVTDFRSDDKVDLSDFSFVTAEAALAAFQQQGRNAVLDLGNGDKLILKNTLVSDLDADQFIVSDAGAGPSSSSDSYIVPLDSSISTKALLTVGDSPADGSDWQMVGVPDGLGAYDNGDGTFTVLMNQELAPGQGAVRDHGGNGAFISKIVIDKASLEVLTAQDLVKEVYLYNSTTGEYDQVTNYQFNRLCSADLPEKSAFFNAETGLGYDGMIFLSGEETTGGRPFAHFVDGAEAGKSYELAWLGNNAFENMVANPYTGNETVVAMTDDNGNTNSGGNTIASGNGEVFFYFGDKQATGDALTDSGLTGGNLYAIQVAEMPREISTNGSPLWADLQSDFNLVSLGDVSALNGTQIQAALDSSGATKFLRPEDGAWDTVSTNRFYFVTTGNISNPDAPSRLWAVDFNGVPSENGLSGAVDGQIKLLLDGTEGGEMFDNITVTKDGKVLLQEDVGGNNHLGKIWEYDPSTDTLTALAQHDPDLFLAGSANFLTNDEESSGIIDVTDILGSAGQNVFLFDVQAHYNIPGELVQGGQLNLMYQDLI